MPRGVNVHLGLPDMHIDIDYVIRTRGSTLLRAWLVAVCLKAVARILPMLPEAIKSTGGKNFFSLSALQK